MASVLLLGELHEDSKSIMENFFEIQKILASKDKLLDSSHYLMVSEGRQLNTAFNPYHPPHSSVLIEYGERQTKKEMLIKLLVTVNLLISILNGSYKPGMKCKHIPESVAITPEFFLERAMHTDGFWDIFDSIENGVDIYIELIRAAFRKNKKHFNEYYQGLLRRLISGSFLRTIDIGRDIEIYIQHFLHLPHRTILVELLEFLQENRDEEIIRKIEHVVSQNHKIKIIILIFGRSHYDNLEDLIKSSRVLKLHSKSHP